MVFLDGYEGVPQDYLRISIPYENLSGEQNVGQIYIAHPSNLVCSLNPETEYLHHIKVGYDEHGFDRINLNRIVPNK